MQIVLMANFESGQAGFSPERIEGYDAPRRAYDVVGGKVVLAGHPDLVLHHDADALLGMAGGLYRMPTPAEQDEMAGRPFRTGELQESAGSIPIVTEDTSPDGTEQAPDGSEQGEVLSPDEPPALGNKKKASGG